MCGLAIAIAAPHPYIALIDIIPLIALAIGHWCSVVPLKSGRKNEGEDDEEHEDSDSDSDTDFDVEKEDDEDIEADVPSTFDPEDSSIAPPLLFDGLLRGGGANGNATWRDVKNGFRRCEKRSNGPWKRTTVWRICGWRPRP